MRQGTAPCVNEQSSLRPSAGLAGGARDLPSVAPVLTGRMPTRVQHRGAESLDLGRKLVRVTALIRQNSKFAYFM